MYVGTREHKKYKKAKSSVLKLSLLLILLLSIHYFGLEIISAICVTNAYLDLKTIVFVAYWIELTFICPHRELLQWIISEKLSSWYLNIFSLKSSFVIKCRSTTEQCPFAIIVMSLQSILGVIIQACMAGIIFAKFTVPRNRGETIVFSKNAVITMRNGSLYLVRKMQSHHRWIWGHCRNKIFGFNSVKNSRVFYALIRTYLADLKKTIDILKQYIKNCRTISVVFLLAFSFQYLLSS